MMGLCFPGCDCTCLGFVHAVVCVCVQLKVESPHLARISKMPIQNSSSKISACPDLATNLLQILTPTTSNSLLCQKRKLTLQPSPRIWSVRKIILVLPPKVKIEFFLYQNFARKLHFQETTCPKDRQGGSWLSP